MSLNPWLDDSPVEKGPNRWADDDDEEDYDPEKDYFTQVVARKEHDMVKSTERSLRMLNDSEQIGADTGVELIRQGEVLRRTEKKVDQMEQDLKESDRHIASIKSMWGAFLNKFRKEPVPPPVVNQYEDEKVTNSSLENAVMKSQVASSKQQYSYDDHPVLSRQDEDRELYNGRGPSSKSAMKAQVDDNLDLMVAGLSRLKSLGQGLGEEIDAQDKVLTRLGDKVTRVDDKTHTTNKELIKLNR